MKAYKLIATPDKWTQNEMARDAKGESCDPNHPDAVAFCLSGACQVAYPNRSERIKIREKIGIAIGGERATRWNDHPDRTHAEVVALLRKLDI